MHAVVLFAIIHLLTTVAGVMDVEVHMLSFNIRTSLASIDARSSCGNWDGIRKTNVVNTIKTVAADFVGTQETSDAQKTFLDAQLADIYSVIGENTGHLNDMANEWNAIYYRFDTWKILTNGMFWLGTNPDVMSAGWGMIYYRTCVWGRFQHTKTGASICVLNTHYETPGNDAAQIQGSTIILEHIKTKCDPSDGLIVLMGDFNALKSYPAMRMLFANDLTDPSDDGTFCGDMLSGTCSTKYDYTMFRAQNKDACHLESKISRINYNGCYSSDHAGLVSTFCLQGSCCLKSSSGSRSIYSSFYENRIADDKDELGTVKGSNFSTVFHRKRTPKVDTEANTSVTMPKFAVESSSPSSPDPAQTIYMSSGGGNSASTSVGIILGSLA
ncbi:putative endonuclease/exonuclease/phosphatase [Plasmopara halstedii]